MVRLLSGVSDDQLSAQTPCKGCPLGELIDHVSGLSSAFTAAATKNFGPETARTPTADASHLGADWRTRIPEEVLTLAAAWGDRDAWQGMTQAGGADLPAELAGKIAMNELVIHGWDVARASGQAFECDPQALDASMDFVALMSTPEQESGRDGLFGPVVDVPAGASRLDRVIGLSGRNPSWSPS
jgi:uncharacterized protein (TIGR03086 family)